MFIRNGQTSVIIRFKLLDSSSTVGAGLTGLTNASTGLIISTIADSESSATAYTVAASHIQTIATLGTYAAPSASNCRFGEVDSTNHPGIYEFQFANARFSVANAMKLLISVSGATNLIQADYEVQLANTDPQTPRGTVTTGGSTTSVPTSTFTLGNITAAGVVLNQFAGRVVLFDQNTTTAGLAGAAGVITASTASNTPTLTILSALPATPASGDTFSII